MLLRQWEEADIAEIAAIEKACFTSPWSQKMLYDTFLCGKFTGFFAQEGGKILGYGGYVASFGHADITKIAVLENSRRMGVASRLLCEILSSCEMENIQTVSLEVRVSNLAAIGLYEKYRFKKIAVRKKYYGDEDAYVMQYQFEG